MADGPGGLQAMVIGIAPPFALIVEDAARVETEIAADRAHVAVSWAGNVRGRLRDDGIVLVDRGVLGDLGETYRRTEFQSLLIGFDRMQLLHAVHVDQHRRRHDAAPDIDDQVGTAAERHAVRVRFPRRDHFIERFRIEHAEFGQGVHYRPPAFPVMAGLVPAIHVSCSRAAGRRGCPRQARA